MPKTRVDSKRGQFSVTSGEHDRICENHSRLPRSPTAAVSGLPFVGRSLNRSIRERHLGGSDAYSRGDFWCFTGAHIWKFNNSNYRIKSLAAIFRLAVPAYRRKDFSRCLFGRNSTRCVPNLLGRLAPLRRFPCPAFLKKGEGFQSSRRI